MTLVIKTRQDFRRAILRGAWRGMVIQGGPAANCSWRDGEGGCCGVGWLIPDDRLPPAVRRCGVVRGLSGEAVDNHRLAAPLDAWADAYAPEARADIHAIQTAHDTSYASARAIAVYARRLRELAAEWGVPLPLDEYPDPTPFARVEDRL